jgi:hypothetical protein
MQFEEDVQLFLGFAIGSGQNEATVVIPYWFPVLVVGALSMLLRAKWPLRFNVLVLFAVTTLLAIVLGMIACLPRTWPGT